MAFHLTNLKTQLLTVAWFCGSALTAPGATTLLDAATNNGSFESLNPGSGNVTTSRIPGPYELGQWTFEGFGIKGGWLRYTTGNFTREHASDGEISVFADKSGAGGTTVIVTSDNLIGTAGYTNPVAGDVITVRVDANQLSTATPTATVQMALLFNYARMTTNVADAVTSAAFAVDGVSSSSVLAPSNHQTFTYAHALTAGEVAAMAGANGGLFARIRLTSTSGGGSAYFDNLRVTVGEPLTNPPPVDILIADFEGSAYGAWTKTGTCFGTAPATNALPGQQAVTGYEGLGFVNTYLGGDGSTGTLTSPLFTIQRNYVNFLIGGGYHPGRTCINLILADGRVAHSTPGDNNERLKAATWDVSSFLGQQARIQIVDNETGGWGHINVDSIVQSNTNRATLIQPPWDNVVTLDYVLTLPITNQYLNLPVDDAQAGYVVQLRNPASQPVAEFSIRLARGTPVFWAALDVSAYQGQSVSLYFDAIPTNHPALGLIYQSAQKPNAPGVYQETYRPRFHYSPRVGWVNDPNGLVYYNGTWHFFYQYNPYGTTWANMHWGYATSTNLVHWQDHGIGVTPPLGKLAYSGGGVVDWNNTTRLQTGTNPPILLYVTVPGVGQHLYYSDNGGGTWKAYPNNPVTTVANRDPKVFWYAPGGHWVMTLFSGNYNGTFNFLTSTNGINWTQQPAGLFPGHNECPDMFQIQAEDSAVKKWVFLSGAGNFGAGDCAKYLVGTFDGVTFTPEQDSVFVDSGNGNYSTQVFSDGPNGRHVLMGWFTRNFSTPAIAGMPANAQFRVPWDLTLYATNGGYRLRCLPVPELAQLRGTAHHWTNLTLTSGQTLNALVNPRELDITTTIRPAATGTFSFLLGGRELKYDCASQILSGFSRSASLVPRNGVIQFRLLLDRTSVELFANDGTVVMTGFHQADFNKNALAITSQGGTTLVQTLTAHEMNSIWDDPNGDDDHDGLPNGWERLYFGNPTNANPTVDFDLDGQNTGEEYVAGTNPTNAASRFVITSVNSAPVVGTIIEWGPTITNRFYDVLRTTNLTQPFSVLQSNLVSPRNRFTNAPGLDPQRLYRVRVRLP